MKKKFFVPFLLVFVFMSAPFVLHAEEVLPEEATTEEIVLEEETLVEEEPAPEAEVITDEPSEEEEVAEETPIEESEEVSDEEVSETEESEGEETVLDPEPASSATFIIRAGGTVLFNGTVTIPDEAQVEISDSTDTAHSVSSRSVLALFTALDEVHDEFAITDLSYYASYSSFYLKCVTPQDAEELCDNWQYAVGATTPYTSIDTTVLSGGETVGLYFGSPHRVSFNSTSIAEGEALIATAEAYEYLDDSWSPLTGVTIGATVPDPENPWSPIVIASQAVDTDGTATITLTEAGEYFVGIAEDYYFPSYAITVAEAPVEEVPPVQSSGGGGGGSSTPAPVSFTVSSALEYLYSVQNSDGSFGSTLYTDWAAIAFGAAGASESAKTNILSYLSSHANVGTLLTDNERRAIALLSLGQDPYSFAGTDYITPIVSAFDGTQFGDVSLVNDDIFALLPISSAGYSAGDDIIAKDIAFIVSKQRADGSWEGSVDLTAAAVQALIIYGTAPDAMQKASEYLESVQQQDGGFGSVYSTSWAAQAMRAIGTSWTKNGKTPLDHLAATQASDGAAIASSDLLQNRIWATSYAIPAALGKPWRNIMQSVAKPAVPVAQSAGGGGVAVTEEKKEEVIKEEKEEIIETPVVAEIIKTETPVIVEAPVQIAQTPAPVLVSAPVRTISVPEVSVEEIIEEEVTAKVEIETTIPLTASAGESGAAIPLPIAVGTVASLGSLAFVARWFLRI